MNNSNKISYEQVFEMIDKASRTQDADDALKFAQAAESAANALSTVQSNMPLGIGSIGFSNKSNRQNSEL